jgi:hypothetical protein
MPVRGVHVLTLRHLLCFVQEVGTPDFQNYQGEPYRHEHNPCKSPTQRLYHHTA